MIGMGMALAQFDHGGLHGRRLRPPLLEPRVERDHEVLRALVVDVPQTENQRLRTRLEQAAGQPDQLISGSNYIQPGRAPAENHQLGRQLKVINIVEAQVRVPEANRREHGVVLPEISVRRNMDNPAVAAMGPQHFLGGLLTDE